MPIAGPASGALRALGRRRHACASPRRGRGSRGARVGSIAAIVAGAAPAPSCSTPPPTELERLADALEPHAVTRRYAGTRRPAASGGRQPGDRSSTTRCSGPSNPLAPPLASPSSTTTASAPCAAPTTTGTRASPGPRARRVPRGRVRPSRSVAARGVVGSAVRCTGTLTRQVPHADPALHECRVPRHAERRERAHACARTALHVDRPPAAPTPRSSGSRPKA